MIYSVHKYVVCVNISYKKSGPEEPMASHLQWHDYRWLNSAWDTPVPRTKTRRTTGLWQQADAPRQVIRFGNPATDLAVTLHGSPICWSENHRNIAHTHTYTMYIGKYPCIEYTIEFCGASSRIEKKTVYIEYPRSAHKVFFQFWKVFFDFFRIIKISPVLQHKWT